MPEEPQYLSLTTTGRRSGLPREIEIWFTERDGRHHVIAEHGERAQWVKNLRAEPRVTVRLRGRRFAATARVVDARGEPALVADVRKRSEQKYGWGDGLVVELTRVTRARSGRSTPRRSTEPRPPIRGAGARRRPAAP